MKQSLSLYLVVIFLGLMSNFLVAQSRQQGGKAMDSCPELTGRVIISEDPGYSKSRLVSNYYSSKNKFPKVVVYCQNTQDVQNAVKWARCHQVPIRIRSGGHNHEAFSTGTDVIVIDVSEMKQLQIDKAKQLAIVQPGVTGQELYRKLYEVGLTQVGGTCGEVGISGLVLTGGMGPLARRVGLACDTLQFIEIVDTNGNLIHATKDNEYKDLFWASQGGGGGNFGVVVLIGLKVYPANQVTWFNLGWDWNQPVEQVIATWQDFFSKDDRRWFSHLDIWAKAFPVDKFKKQPVKVMGVFWGTPEEARRELEPFLKIGQLNDRTIELVDWVQVVKLFEDATSVFITDKPEYKSSGAYVMENFSPEAIRTIVDTLRNSPAPLLNVLLFTLGGATQEIAPTDTAYFYRNAKYFAQYSSQWLKEQDDQKQIAEVDQLREKLLPFAWGDYVGNPDRNLKNYLEDYYGSNARRLRCIKRKYDPDNVFQHEQSIPPAPADWKCD